MNDRHTSDRDEFERILRAARLQRASYLGEAIAGAAAAIWKRLSALLSPRIPRIQRGVFAAR